MGAYMSDEGDNKTVFRRVNGEVAQRVWDKLSSRGATIDQIDPNWKASARDAVHPPNPPDTP